MLTLLGLVKEQASSFCTAKRSTRSRGRRKQAGGVQARKSRKFNKAGHGHLGALQLPDLYRVWPYMTHTRLKDLLDSYNEALGQAEVMVQRLRPNQSSYSFLEGH